MSLTKHLLIITVFAHCSQKSAVITRDLNEYKYYLDLTHPIDETGKWKEITQDRIIVANEQPFRIKFVQKTSREIVAYCEQIFLI